MNNELTFRPIRSRICALLFAVTLFGLPMTTASALALNLIDDSGARGIGEMCFYLLEGTARSPGLEPLLQRIYQAGQQDIQAATKLNVGTPDDVAEAIGRIRGGQIMGTARNPSLAPDLERVAKQCLADVKRLNKIAAHRGF